MRIISGKWRSRRLRRPKTAQTRPVPDRVREAVFDILGAYYQTGGSLPALRVSDVFAGSGSMGLEALSRGARSCCFFERSRTALVALRANLMTLGVASEARIVVGDAWRRGVATPDGQPFDLILLDPPYSDSDDTSPTGPVKRFLRRLDETGPSRRLVVLHHRSAVRSSEYTLATWRILDHRTYGSSSIAFLTR